MSLSGLPRYPTSHDDREYEAGDIDWWEPVRRLLPCWIWLVAWLVAALGMAWSDGLVNLTNHFFPGR